MASLSLRPSRTQGEPLAAVRVVQYVIIQSTTSPAAHTGELRCHDGPSHENETPSNERDRVAVACPIPRRGRAAAPGAQLVRRLVRVRGAAATSAPDQA